MFKALFSLLGTLSPAHIFLVTQTSGAKRVGTDPLGNRYYQAPPRTGYSRDRRWVIYKGKPDASKVPPEFHAWLHHQSDEWPSEETSFRRPWQKPHKANLSGTDQAYQQPGHPLSGTNRPKVGADYEAWTPPA